MKKRLILIMMVLTMLSACTKENSDSRPLVITTMYPIYDLTTRIAKDKVNVQNIAPLSMEVHDYEPSAKDLIQLESAQYLIAHGNHLEGWLESTLAGLQNKELKVLVLSEGVELIEGDVHTWLSLDVMMDYATKIQLALSEMDPDHESEYQDNSLEWINEARELKAKYASLYDRTHVRDVIVDHLAFAYLMRDIKMNQVSITQGALANDISAKGLKTMIEKIQNENVKMIYKDEASNDNLFKLLQTETNVQVGTLSTLEVMSTENYRSYLEMMETNLEALERGVMNDSN